jgi:hypothetical protein
MEASMQADVFLGIARHVLTALGPIVAMSGVMDAPTYDILAGATLTIGGTAWSVWDKLRRR